jgi:hypothetical protein
MRGFVLLAMTFVLAACVDDTRPSSCESPAATLELTLTAESLTPTDPAVCRDQAVTLVIASDVDGVIHIHGYDDHVDATEVTAGEELRLEFSADAAGQFPVELHTDDAPAGTSVGVFTVHEP